MHLQGAAHRRAPAAKDGYLTLSLSLSLCLSFESGLPISISTRYKADRHRNDKLAWVIMCLKLSSLLGQLVSFET